jgi:hypothetical protein
MGKMLEDYKQRTSEDEPRSDIVQVGYLPHLDCVIARRDEPTILDLLKEPAEAAVMEGR